MRLLKVLQIIDGKDKARGPDAIPSILTDALAVGFDNSVGHDYLLDADARFDYYHTIEEKIPFDLEFFNRITKGGLPPKTLNIALAGTGVGKSLFMCHMAANCMNQGKNVLYITLEMAEERIAERIDANLMNVSMEDLHELPKTMYDSKIEKIIRETNGQLVIKEYPTASAHSAHFRGLIKELAIKKSFKPDIIFIDYLNICASSRFKGASKCQFVHVYQVDCRGTYEDLQSRRTYQSCLQHRRLALDSPIPMWVLKIPVRVLDYRLLLTSCLHSLVTKN